MGFFFPFFGFLILFSGAVSSQLIPGLITEIESAEAIKRGNRRRMNIVHLILEGGRGGRIS